MGDKLLIIVVTWIIIGFTYVMMGFFMPAFNSIVATANTSLEASANMSNFPGTQEAVQSSPLWIWFIPGGVGIVYTVIKLKSKD